MKYSLLHLGCQMNQSDAERIRTVLEGMGYERTDIEEEADLLGIVACSVRQKAIDKVYSRIARWNKWKAERPLLTFVSGCILPSDRDKFLKRFDLLFTINELPQVPDMIRQYGVVTPASADLAVEEYAADASESFDAATGYWKIKPRYSSSFEAYIPIQNGCDKFCTFCAVPYTRGREVSRNSDEILAELESLLDRGYRSVTLLGQNVNSYGQDRRGSERSFAELLREVGELGRRRSQHFWTYFTSPHPRDMTEDVLETIAEYDCLAKQIHLPLQSGDDKLLMRMNRNHSVERYRDVVGNIRRLLPDATLFTDIIVGFSGETEQQFENTRRAMQEFAYHMAFIAIYSPRPGAASARWDDDIPQDEKKRRLHILSEELKVSSLRHNESLLGRTVPVLVDGTDRREGFLSGKTEGKVIVRFPSRDTSLIGRFVNVKMTSCVPLSLTGELVSVDEPVYAAGVG
jgi:tRNA-2-methylthio-N6-dimethylallyladenosine synthase